MIVRRLLGGALLSGLAVPLLAAAPHPSAPRAHDVLPFLPGARVFARAEPAARDQASPAPAATDEPQAPPPLATGPTPEITARARAVFEANRAGKIDRTQYTADMNGRITDAELARASVELRSLGEVKSFTQVRKITQGPITLYVFRIELAKAPVIEQVVGWNEAGQVRFLQFGAVPQ
ncbi:MAG: hypothetical protein JO036_04720 [Candidatus Eremiobacteraeota bacterium]|nr:hypothetical protein [Candidatus Eremiobacteraeota bacterium]